MWVGLGQAHGLQPRCWVVTDRLPRFLQALGPEVIPGRDGRRGDGWLRQPQTAMDTNQGKLYAVGQPEQTLRKGPQLSAVRSRARECFIAGKVLRGLGVCLSIIWDYFGEELDRMAEA